MARPKPKLCKADNHKVCLSEAQALRRANRYDEIQRFYKCPHCNDFHLTSKEDKYAHIKKERPLVDVTVEDLEEMINEIKKRIENG